uniref:Uncharacterized protein n=1 Tax=Panagrolaimus superbus TaxID=310955 RepID=A0A914YQN7_9BILA
MSQEARKIIMNNIDVRFYCNVIGGRNYEHYKCFHPPSEAVSKFMTLMLKEFPCVLDYICDQHDKIHTILKKEGGECTITKSFSKGAQLCEDVVNIAIQDCFRFCILINNHHFVMPLRPHDVLLSENSFDKIRLGNYRGFFELFFEALIDKFNEKSLSFNPMCQKLLEDYSEAKKRNAALPMLAAKNRIKLENQQQDLKKKLATIIERNEKRVDRIGYLLKIHDKCISESENCMVKAKSSNVQKKSVDDLIAKTAEKEADMERMTKLLAALKDQLLNVKKSGMQRKNSIAILKAEKEKLQELDLTFLQLRFQNITTSIVDFVNHRKCELAHLNKLLSEVSAEQKNLVYENMKLLFVQINEEKEKLKRLEAAYKQYMFQVRQGTMLATLPPIDLKMFQLLKKQRQHQFLNLLKFY